MSQEMSVLEYPVGLGRIPYASFLEINRYEYQEAMDKVAKSQNDALGALQRSKLASSIVDTVGNVQEFAYGAGEYSEGQQKKYNEEFDLVKPYEKEISINNGKRTRTETIRRVNITDPNIDRSLLIKVNGEEISIGELLDMKEQMKNQKDKGLMLKKCLLPLPNEFQYKYGADWNNEFKLGTLAMAADDFGKFSATVTAGAGIGAVGSWLTQWLSKGVSAGKAGGVDVNKLVQAGASGAGTAANLYGVNSKLDPTNLAGLAGLAPNENSIQFFQRMQGREFSFRFELAARNEKESKKIISIIEWFKRGMHPGSKQGRGSAVLLTFPDVFTLVPKFVKCGTNGLPLGEPIQHPMMPKTKICALTNLQINTTPFGQLQTVFDGTVPLVTMELTFKETTKLTRVDMEGAMLTDKRTSKILFASTSEGTFTRDPDSDHNGRVTY
tara:strand:- start:982 stop:2301 length:1320 start_codon:yes stop_codon:yes gene_type:complete